MSFDELVKGLPDAKVFKDTANRISDLTSQLSERASTIAERLGMHGPVFQVGGIENPKTIEETLAYLLKPAAIFQITRVGDVWDIFYSQTISFQTMGKREWQRVSSCRLDIKALFIRHAQEIFAAYFRHVKGFVENIHKDLVMGDAVIKELQELL